MFAGAAALTAVIPQVHSQTSVDNLLNKLEQKGILTVDEADQLKSENATNSVADFNKELNSRLPIPDWVTGYKLSGDFRGRFDEQTSDNSTFENRTRFRYRVRAGLTVLMKDNLEVGFRVASGGNTSGNGATPLSNNTTLTGNGSKKSLYVDTAYGKWSPIIGDDWTLSGTIGKMVNPYQLTPMVFDPDYTPEGGAIQTLYKFSNTQSISAVGSAFVINDSSSGVSGGLKSDAIIYGGQVAWNAKWTPKVASSLGVAAFDLSDHNGQLTTANYPLSFTGNQGNSRTAGGALLYDYNPIVGDASATYTLDSFPLYTGAFPIKLAGEIMNNPAAPSNNEGYWGGVTFGQAVKKGSWDVTYRYEYLEQNAWWDQIVDDDNVGYYANASGSFIAGMLGGTNIKGHMVKVNYALTDGLMFTATCFVNELINQNIGGVAEPKNGAIHFMADLMWKF